VYGSNFWEQLTIGASIGADRLLNEGSGAWIAAVRGGKAFVATRQIREHLLAAA
jgi:hypothetical protein